MLSDVVILSNEWQYTKSRYAESYSWVSIMLSVAVILSVLMNVSMLSVVMLSVIERIA